mmetsp:Transcript_17113/g.51077  ORF Transcript_17113/g.51077 Transcript_17113/m.51077 type:complete len:228 (-) Transcript_17113:292-975(-)
MFLEPASPAPSGVFSCESCTVAMAAVSTRSAIQRRPPSARPRSATEKRAVVRILSWPKSASTGPSRFAAATSRRLFCTTYVTAGTSTLAHSAGAPAVTRASSPRAPAGPRPASQAKRASESAILTISTTRTMARGDDAHSPSAVRSSASTRDQRAATERAAFCTTTPAKSTVLMPQRPRDFVQGLPGECGGSSGALPPKSGPFCTSGEGDWPPISVSTRFGGDGGSA